MENLESLKNFDVIIDVRTPREFAHSHIPRAINLAVFSDDEFDEIGTLYKQNALEANLKGASLACKNIAKILEDNREIFNYKHKILIYCARGGNRSLSLFLILSALKIRAERLNGGYKRYRNLVLSEINARRSQRFLTLCGLTGCGKSELIKMAKEDKNGAWSVDLEDLCDHRGSVFGGFKESQKSVKMFENSLIYELCEISSPIILIENESKKLGNLVIPSAIFEAYQRAPKILITAPLNARIARIVEMYRDIKDAEFRAKVAKIARYIESGVKNDILKSWENGDLARVAELLLVKYYDKVYREVKCDFCVKNDEGAYEKICEIRDKLI